MTKIQILTLIGTLSALSHWLAAGTLVTNIDDLPLATWQSCGDPPCAGGLGTALIAIDPNNTVHSLDGGALRLTLSGAQAYSNGLVWNNELGAGPSTDALNRFVMSMVVYLDPGEAGRAQALDFTMQQTFCTFDCSGAGAVFTRFTYSMQCDFKDTGHWRIWDTNNWTATPSVCASFASGVFGDLVFLFSRPDLLHVRYDGFSVNGSFTPLSMSGGVIFVPPSEEYLASMQLDGDRSEEHTPELQ